MGYFTWLSVLKRMSKIRKLWVSVLGFNSYSHFPTYFVTQDHALLVGIERDDFGAMRTIAYWREREDVPALSTHALIADCKLASISTS